MDIKKLQKKFNKRIKRKPKTLEQKKIVIIPRSDNQNIVWNHHGIKSHRPKYREGQQSTYSGGVR